MISVPDMLVEDQNTHDTTLISKENMEHILVPINFTPATDISLAHAIGIAQASQKTVIMCHFVTSTIPLGANAVLHKKEIKEKHDKAYMEMRVLLTQYANHTYDETAQPVLIEPLVMEGHPDESIEKIVQDNSISMVVLSHKDSNEIKDLFLNNKVVREANCPILTIPEDAIYKPLNHVVYAANFDGNDAKRIRDLIELTSSFDAKLDCLHVCTDGKKLREENEKMQELQAEFDVVLFSKLSFKVIRDSKSVTVGLENYLSKNKPDMLVMLKTEQNFFKKLFSNKTSIRKMALDNGMPIMMYREPK
ncbi:universal stress protein [Bernardetia sp.]|uniref:universal stress protein n=1 Tax=Bernardetia sp. TaxID=1937974 RepID=UPI0025BA4F23|nr:universal stress protein [Bernardetia sp.]